MNPIAPINVVCLKPSERDLAGPTRKNCGRRPSALPLRTGSPAALHPQLALFPELYDGSLCGGLDRGRIETPDKGCDGLLQSFEFALIGLQCFQLLGVPRQHFGPAEAEFALRAIEVAPCQLIPHNTISFHATGLAGW